MLYRNTTSQEGVYLLLAELENPDVSEYVDFVDNFTDQDIDTNETDGLYKNPRNAQGMLPAYARGHLHSTNRVFLYGLEERNVYRLGTVDLTLDTDIVESTASTLCRFESGMIGCRFRPKHTSVGVDIVDDTVYRIIEIISDTKIRVTPNIKTNVLMAGGAAVTSLEIIDDRSGMTFHISEPGKPWSYDPLGALSPANSSADRLRFIGAYMGKTFLVSSQSIYVLLDDYTVSPIDTIRFQEVVQEGTWGLWSCCVTPFGLVYVNDLGVRVFNGQSAPVPLGASPTEEFPSDLLANADSSFKRYIRVYYNPTTKLVHVSYAVAGTSRTTAELVFSPATNAWRGPWYREITAADIMLNEDGSSVFVTGGMWGDLGEDGEQELDNVNPTTHVISGTVALIYNTEPRFIGVESDVDVEGDARVLGCNFFMTSAAGDIFYSKVAGVINSTTLVLADYYDPNVVWTTYSIGAIRWDLLTAYLDGGEPIQPKTLEYVRLRFDRGDNAETFEVVSISEDDGTEVVDEGGDVDVNNSIYRLARPEAGGRAFQLKLRGTAESGLPRLTTAVVDMTIGEGA